MAWKRSSEKLIERFTEFLKNFPDGELRKTFGYPCCFVKGNMCTGLHEENWIVRLSEEDRMELMKIHGAKPFEPMKGRIMREYLALPPAIQKETNRNDLALICHSKGGLVGSYFATHLAETNTRITDVITIGSPLAGTPLATLGPGYDAHEMRTDSKFHQELRKKMKERQEIRFSHIASAVDDIVPLSSALGKNPSRQLVLNDMGHVGLLFSSRVANQICRWLYQSHEIKS